MFVFRVSVEFNVSNRLDLSAKLLSDILFIFLGQIPVSSTDLQKIKRTIDNLFTEKQKMDKEKNKKGSKGKTKVNLRIETESVSSQPTIYNRNRLKMFHFSFCRPT